MIDFITNLWQWLCDNSVLLNPHEGQQIAIAPVVAAAAISAATSIANGIFGAASARKQKRAQDAANAQQQAEENAWYNRRYNEDATQRADAQRILTKANDAIKKRSLAAAGKKAVIGGTDASQAAVQQANAEAMGDAVSKIASNAEARKDKIDEAHRTRISALQKEKATNDANYEETRRKNMAQAATGVANAAASVVANMPSGSAAAKAPVDNRNLVKVDGNASLQPTTASASYTKGDYKMPSNIYATNSKMGGALHQAMQGDYSNLMDNSSLDNTSLAYKLIHGKKM